MTNEPEVASLAGAAGATVLADPAESGQSAAALVGIAHALRDSATSARCWFPATARRSTARHCGTLLERPAGAPAVTIVPDRHGSGTNALLLTPPDAIEPGFGPGSFERHRRRAAAAGAAWHVEPLRGAAARHRHARRSRLLRVALARPRATRTGALLERALMGVDLGVRARRPARRSSPATTSRR